MKVFITGATGFIGTSLVNELVKRQYKVTCFVRKTSNIQSLNGLGVKFSYGDILDEKSIEKAIGDNEVIIHLVGLQSFVEYSKKLYDSLYKINVLGLKNLLDAVVVKKPKKLKKIVFLSSTAAVGLTNGEVDEKVRCKPVSPYQRTKYEGERLCLSYYQKYGVPIVILRPSMIYGNKDDHSQIQGMVNTIRNGFFPIVGSGKNNVPMIYLSDAVDGIIKGALKGKPGEIYYMTNDKKTTMSELVGIIGSELGINVIKIRVPVFIAYILVAILGGLYKLVGKDFTMSGRRVLSMSSDRTFDVSKARKGLGFSPRVSVREGICKAISTYGVR